MRAALLVLALVSCGGYVAEASHSAAEGAMSAVAERAPAIAASSVASAVPAIERRALAQGLLAERRALAEVAPVVGEAKKQAEDVVHYTASEVTHEADVVRDYLFELIAFGGAIVALVSLALHWRPR